MNPLAVNLQTVVCMQKCIIKGMREGVLRVAASSASVGMFTLYIGWHST